MNVETIIKELYKRYLFNKDGYVKKDEKQYQRMSASDINRNDKFSAFKIYGVPFNKHKTNCVFIDGEIIKSVIGIRSSQNIFINIHFNESKFDSCSFKETLFINCLFEDVDFKTSGLHDVVFLNCEFEECRMNDIDMENIHFINTDPSQIINVLTEKPIVIDSSNMKKIEDKSVFGIFKVEVKEFEKNEVKKSEEGDRIVMNNRYNNQKFKQCEVDLSALYYDCEFEDIIISQGVAQDTYFQNCRFMNCHFVDVKFRSVIFDNSIFEKCHFELVTMNRCSLVDVKMDKETFLGVEFVSCHTFNMQLECDVTRATFNCTYNPNILYKEESMKNNNELEEDVINYESVLSQLEYIVSKMKTKEYKKSIENERKISENDIYDFFKNKDLSQVMMMISKITASFIGSKDKKSDVM